jgi:hypothetical protein
MCSRYEDGLSQTGIVCTYRLGCGRYRTKVIGAFDLGCLWVQRFREALEAFSGLCDLFVRVSSHWVSHPRNL